MNLFSDTAFLFDLVISTVARWFDHAHSYEP